MEVSRASIRPPIAFSLSPGRECRAKAAILPVAAIVYGYPLQGRRSQGYCRGRPKLSISTATIKAQMQFALDSIPSGFLIMAKVMYGKLIPANSRLTSTLTARKWQVHSQKGGT